MMLHMSEEVLFTLVVSKTPPQQPSTAVAESSTMTDLAKPSTIDDGFKFV